MKWEYLERTLKTQWQSDGTKVKTLEAQLNEFGKMGWELVAVCVSSNFCSSNHARQCFFKRPKE